MRFHGNAATVMRPELQSWFSDGLWFFDLMTEAERIAALSFYVTRYKLTKAQTAKLPDFDGWTGREIRNLCRSAANTGITLVEAAQFVVPMARSRALEIKRLRSEANNKFLDAAKPGPYYYDPAPMKKQVRAIQLPAQVLEAVASMKES
jgi:hypothetical protein